MPSISSWLKGLLYRYIARSPEQRKQLWKRLRAEFESKDSLEERMRRKYPQLAFAMPGHFYSPLPVIEQALNYRQQYGHPSRVDLPGIQINAEDQLKLVHELVPYFERYDWPATAPSERRYYSENSQFLSGDAAMLYALLCHYRPARVIEIGSGYSSALMLDAREREGLNSHYTFIEPYPDRLKRLLRSDDASRVTLIEKPIQEVDHSLFLSLQASDFLFIDSSHVSKAGSDVNHLLFEILPLLAPGVLVHLHDVFWPFEYTDGWIAEGRAWNELYLLRAFLAYNQTWKILCFGHYLGAQHGKTVPAAMRHCGFGGYLWMIRS